MSKILKVAVALAVIMLGYFYTTSNSTSEEFAPAFIDVGTVARGEKSESQFTIRNTTSLPVVFSGFTVSCGCLGLKIERSGVRIETEGFTLQPSESVDCIVTIQPLTLEPTFRHYVRFSTNHSMTSNHMITISGKVHLGVFATYDSLTWGNVNPGDSPEMTVDLIDARNDSASLSMQLFVDHPAFTIISVNAADTISSELLLPSELKRYRVKLRFDAPFDDSVVHAKLLVRDRSLNLLPVCDLFAIVKPLARLIPSVVVFPLVEDDGDRIVRVVCEMDHLATLELRELPRNFEVHIHGSIVELKCSKNAFVQPGLYPIVFTAIAKNGKTAILTLPVRIPSSVRN